MKTIMTILATIITVVGLSQKYKTYDLNECPMYSRVWKAKYVPDVFDRSNFVTQITPKNADLFASVKTDILKTVDEAKVQQYMLEAFNQFRTDYKLPTVTENVEVSKQADEYSSKVLVDYKHCPTLPKNQSECLAILPAMMLSSITKADGDINKIIAECCFDTFVGCPAHMSLLLDPLCKSYGFGVTVVNNRVAVIVRGIR